MVVAAIDAGTTGVRCMITDRNGAALGIGRRKWTYTTPNYLEIAKEFDADAFWKIICIVTREAIQNAGVETSKIEAVATTSQRHGIVFLDADGNELYAGPNIDARGAMSQYVIEDAIGEKYFEITGCWPPMMFGPSRLAWFEEEAPEIHSAIAHVLPINDWISYKLCGIYSTDPSAASATGFLDIKKRRWSKEVVTSLNLDLKILPEIHDAGTKIGEVTLEAENDCGLPQELSVIQGGADSQSAALACQAKPGEVVVIGGSTSPVLLILDEPICSFDQKVWTGCHILPNIWVQESNASNTGALLEWIVGLLCERAESPNNCIKETFTKLPDLLCDVSPGSNETIAALGPNIMDCHEMTSIPLGRIFFPQPTLPQIVALNAANLIHSVLENIVYSIRGNCEQLEEYSEFQNIKAIGGLTQSDVFLKLVANIMGKSVNTPIQPEGSLLGASICAAKGVGWYPSLSAAADEMVQWRPAYEPDDRVSTYKSYYKKWRNEIWCRSD
jgi:autoinducer 2 (AI-2) kinase